MRSFFDKLGQSEIKVKIIYAFYTQYSNIPEFQHSNWGEAPDLFKLIREPIFELYCISYQIIYNLRILIIIP
jgi:hypothetical protein